MRRYWWLFGAIALLAGAYYATMSGYLTEREIALTLKHGRRQASLGGQYVDLSKLDHAINKHEQRTVTLRSLTPGANADSIAEARSAVRERLNEVEPLLNVSDGGPAYHEAFDRTERFFRLWRPPSMSCLTPKAHAWSTAVFWVSFALAALSGLVRMFAGPED